MRTPAFLFVMAAPLVGVGVLVACGSDSPATVTGDDASRADGSSPETEGGASSSDDGVYKDGDYTCCGEGKGLTCCSADAGLLGYESLPDGNIVQWGGRPGTDTTANCFGYGGVANACAAEGEVIDRKDICSICCDGLGTIESQCDMGPCVDGGTSYGYSQQICARCGNGECGPGESHGNCPEDCK